MNRRWLFAAVAALALGAAGAEYYAKAACPYYRTVARYLAQGHPWQIVNVDVAPAVPGPGAVLRLTGWVRRYAGDAEPGAKLVGKLQVAAVVESAVIFWTVLLMWPAASRPERCARLLLGMPLFLGLEAATTVCQLLDPLAYASAVLAGDLETVTSWERWSRFLEDGGRIVLALCAAILTVALPSRLFASGWKPRAATESPGAAVLAAALNQARARHRSGDLALAKASYEAILETHPRHFDALLSLGVIAGQTRDFARAAELIAGAIAINPRHARAYSYQGLALQELGRREAALASYDRAVLLDPELASAHARRGNVLRELNRLNEALDGYDRALSIKVDQPEVHLNRGATLQALQRCEEALDSYERALHIKPHYAEAWNNRGNALKELGRLDEALNCYARALAAKPDYAEACYNRANALAALDRYDEALKDYDRAIAIDAEFAQAYCNRGIALQELRRPEMAVASYERAIAISRSTSGG